LNPNILMFNVKTSVFKFLFLHPSSINFFHAINIITDFYYYVMGSSFSNVNENFGWNFGITYSFQNVLCYNCFQDFFFWIVTNIDNKSCYKSLNNLNLILDWYKYRFGFIFFWLHSKFSIFKNCPIFKMCETNNNPRACCYPLNVTLFRLFRCNFHYMLDINQTN
jgi:hypothetical protein